MRTLLTILVTTMLLGISINSLATDSDYIKEFKLAWPSEAVGSTHEINYSHKQGSNDLWITGQNHDHIARVSLDGSTIFHAMPKGSRPHGIAFDADGRLWVSLEFDGSIVRIDNNGNIAETIDVRLQVQGAKQPINPNPHGIAFGPDGRTIWFTGKKTSTIGKVNPDGSVRHFALSTLAAMPINLAAGPDGNMWSTELLGNNILRITPEGDVKEFSIPTYSSRPIAIVPGPNGKYMWFSEEAGNKVGRIDMNGNIEEFPIPLPEKNIILAGLAFDAKGNLWTHSYVNANNPNPAGSDYIVKVDKSIGTAPAGDLSNIPIIYYQVPSRNTIMHRITQGPDGNIWFTELAQDKLGKLVIN